MVVSKTAIFSTVAYVYATTDSEPVRAVMERTLEHLLQERRERRERQELRDLISAHRHNRKVYLSNPSEFVMSITEAMLPKLHYELIERGVDPCTLD